MAPVWVSGRGLVAAPGWISPEQRALMDQARRECEEAEAKRQETTGPREDDLTTGDPSGFVVDPYHGQR